MFKQFRIYKLYKILECPQVSDPLTDEPSNEYLNVERAKRYGEFEANVSKIRGLADLALTVRSSLVNNNKEVRLRRGNKENQENLGNEYYSKLTELDNVLIEMQGSIFGEMFKELWEYYKKSKGREAEYNGISEIILRFIPFEVTLDDGTVKYINSEFNNTILDTFSKVYRLTLSGDSYRDYVPEI